MLSLKFGESLLQRGDRLARRLGDKVQERRALARRDGGLPRISERGGELASYQQVLYEFVGAEVSSQRPLPERGCCHVEGRDASLQVELWKLGRLLCPCGVTWRPGSFGERRGIAAQRCELKRHRGPEEHCADLALEPLA